MPIGIRLMPCISILLQTIPAEKGYIDGVHGGHTGCIWEKSLRSIAEMASRRLETRGRLPLEEIISDIMLNLTSDVTPKTQKNRKDGGFRVDTWDL